MIDTPEVLIPEKKPYVMLTFYDLYGREDKAMVRLKSFLKQKKKRK